MASVSGHAVSPAAKRRISGASWPTMNRMASARKATTTITRPPVPIASAIRHVSDCTNTNTMNTISSGSARVSNRPRPPSWPTNRRHAQRVMASRP